MDQNYLTKHALRLIYYAHIQSHIQYGLLIWGNQCNAKARHAIQKQMYLSTTIINKGNCSSNKQKINKFLELPDLIKLENYKLRYRLLNKMLPDKLSLDITHDKNNNPLTKKHAYNTRNKKQLNIPKHATSSYHNSFLCASI